jgi:hypothetical protein
MPVDEVTTFFRRYWLAITSVLGALVLIFCVGFGFGQRWGAAQWGPFSEWFACVATLSAAVIAYRAIQRQIKAANVGVAEQIKAASRDAASQIEADTKNQRRNERINVAAEALRLLDDIYLLRGSWAVRRHLSEPQTEAEEVARVQEEELHAQLRQANLYALAAKLHLFGMDEEYKALMDFSDEVESSWGTPEERMLDRGAGERIVRYGQLLDLFKAAVDK